MESHWRIDGGGYREYYSICNVHMNEELGRQGGRESYHEVKAEGGETVSEYAVRVAEEAKQRGVLFNFNNIVIFRVAKGLHIPANIEKIWKAIDDENSLGSMAETREWARKQRNIQTNL